jgi:N-methylhydantoinase B
MTPNADSLSTIAAPEALKRYGADLIELETTRYGLIETARNMNEALMRGGFSPIVRDIRDCTAALHMRTDEGWQQVSCWEGAVMHAFTSQHICNFVMEDWDLDQVRKGDTIFVNDPWRGAIHQSDVNVLRPVVIDGEVPFVLHTMAHVADLGGPVPGGFANGAQTHFEEQLKFPPTLLYAEDVPVRSTFNNLLENLRVPALVLGDIRALYGSLVVGERRLLDLIDRWGVEKVKMGGHYGMDMTEASMRRGISELPDGDYHVEDILDDDGVESEPINISMTVKVRGDSMEVDYSGTARQPLGNCGTAWIEATRCIIGAKFIVDPSSPVNSGTLRPVESLLPPGSAVCVLPPSSCSNHNDMGGRVVNMMTAAMSQAQDERAIACDTGTAASMFIGGIDNRPGKEGQPWAAFGLPGGGWGGTWEGDGLSFCIHSTGNCRSSVCEHVERENPLLVWQHEMMTDSSGAGKHRGGAGGVLTLYCQSDTAITLSGDRARAGAPGVLGGGPGMPFYAWLIDEFDPRSALDPFNLSGARPLLGMFDENGVPAPDTGVFGQGAEFASSKLPQMFLKPGQAIRVIIGGGGGWGDPLERDQRLVLADVEEGLHSRDFSEAAYGTVFADGAIDEEATAARRKALSEARAEGRWSVPTACPTNWIKKGS